MVATRLEFPSPAAPARPRDAGAAGFRERSVQEWASDDARTAARAGIGLFASEAELRFGVPDEDGDADDLLQLEIRHAGAVPLVIGEGGLAIRGPQADMFQLLPRPRLPLILTPGEALGLTILFNPGAAASGGQKAAWLEIRCDECDEPVLEVALRAETAGTEAFESQ